MCFELGLWVIVTHNYFLEGMCFFCVYLKSDYVKILHVIRCHSNFSANHVMKIDD